MKQNNGYSLIELLVAVAVFALSIPGLLALFSTASESHRMAINRIRMALLAQTVLDLSLIHI